MNNEQNDNNKIQNPLKAIGIMVFFLVAWTLILRLAAVPLTLASNYIIPFITGRFVVYDQVLNALTLTWCVWAVNKAFKKMSKEKVV